VAIDMSTGEHLWWIPNGDTPERIKNHPALKGLTLPNTGQQSHAVMMATRTLLISAPGGDSVLYAVDKKTGQRLGTVKLPAPGQYGMMTYMHGGRQHIVVQIMSQNHPGSLVALRLPS
jgi:quinoprotein glucose dehydrogenase